MSFLAEATRETTASPERVFDVLANHDAWREWAPRSFRPLGKKKLGTLGVGKKPRVTIDATGKLGMPAKLTVTVADRPRQLTWCGGLGPLLRAEHHFYFDRLDSGGTRIRSVETWSGPLARMMKRVIQPLANKVGKEQIDALASAAEA